MRSCQTYDFGWFVWNLYHSLQRRESKASHHTQSIYKVFHSHYGNHLLLLFGSLCFYRGFYTKLLISFLESNGPDYIFFHLISWSYENTWTNIHVINMFLHHSDESVYLMDDGIWLLIGILMRNELFRSCFEEELGNDLLEASKL